MSSLQIPNRRQPLVTLKLGCVVAVPLLAQAPAAARAVDRMEQLDRMRISPASSLEGSTEDPTMDTMGEVCMPVGQRAKAIGQENGWSVRQVTSRYRNPTMGRPVLSKPGCLIACPGILKAPVCGSPIGLCEQEVPELQEALQQAG